MEIEGWKLVVKARLQGTGKHGVEVGVIGLKDQFIAGFDARYLSTILQSIEGDSIKISWIKDDAYKPFKVQGSRDDELTIIMPVLREENVRLSCQDVLYLSTQKGA